MQLEPHYALVMTSLLTYYPDNTKISISDYSINIRSPTVYQGILRWSYGESRDDVLCLVEPIKLSLTCLSRDSKRYKHILFNLHSGIKKLKLCYILDKRLKQELEELEYTVERIYKGENANTTDVTYSKTIERSWSNKELDHVDAIIENINSLFALESIAIEDKIRLRENLIRYIRST